VGAREAGTGARRNVQFEFNGGKRGRRIKRGIKSEKA
jgi:hypothetical protein